MRRALRSVPIVIFAVLIVCQGATLIDLDAPRGERRQAKAAVIVCEGMIDDGLYNSIRRRTNEALGAGVEYLIYEISTYGGLVSSADDIAKYFIQEIGGSAKTVAYVTTEAISAGALISVSCRDIIMRKNTTIGDCAPVAIGTKLEGVEREKSESFVRAAFSRAAEANNYPPALLKAMVTMQIKVWRVLDVENGTYEFFEDEQLPNDPNRYDLASKELVVRDDELLTLTANQAAEYGIARAVVDDRDGVLSYFEQRDNVAFASEPIELRPSWSEQMVRAINHPAVTGVLFMIALLGVYLELSTPGIGLPGLVAVICFAILIGSKYLWGLANWIEVALFLGGIALLVVELLVLPGFGIAGTLGIVCILAGLFGMLIDNTPDELPWPQYPWGWQQFATGVWALAFGFLGFLVLAWVAGKFMPRLQFMSGLILAPTTANAQASVAMTAPAEGDARIVQVGDVGEVISTLRPAGRARFGEATVDVVATAEFLNKGAKVEIIEIHGSRVVVKAAKTDEA